MEIISHRGYWKIPVEKNESVAFHRSFELGYGTETDFRDLNGEIVISHDMAEEKCMRAEEFFEIYNSHSCEGTLALNVKSDGLQIKMMDLLKKYNIKNYFLFDMSIPDYLKSVNHEFKCYARESEYEVLTDAILKTCQGIWFDYFHSFDFKGARIRELLDMDLKVCLVSPDLHGKDPRSYWESLIDQKFHLEENLIICTDIPEELDALIKSKES